MINIWPSLILLGVCSLAIRFRLKQVYPVAGSLSLVSPSVIFLIGVAGRYGLGSLIMAVTPREHVLSGELDQYIVSWRYSGEAVGLWLGYIGGVILTINFLSRIMDKNKERPQKAGKRSGIFFIWESMKKDETPLAYGVIDAPGFLRSAIAAWNSS